MIGNIHFRIDERLIHGQVVLSWLGMLNVTRIMVVDEEISKDTIQLPLLKMVCPPSVKLSVLAPKNAADNILAGKYSADRVFLLVKNPETLLELWDAGVHMETVNFGNMSGTGDTVMLMKNVNVTQKNIESFKELNRRGVHITVRTIPGDPEVSLMQLIEKGK